jgi:hypothetical protein
MIVDREQLLKEVESVVPGLSARNIIEQSSCFAFQDGKVATFNDEVACFQKTCLKINGAVQADKMLALLRKLTDKTVDISASKSELKIKGKGNRRAGIMMEETITLPIDSIRPPKKWNKLPDDFHEAVTMVQSCVGRDETQFPLTCIHLTPEWIEACDNIQAARFSTTLNMKKPILARKEALKNVAAMGMTEFGITKSWIHFRNPNGLNMSCRLYIESYPEIDPVLQVKGVKARLPKGIEQAVERASIFSNTNANEDCVLVTIDAGRVNIKGIGTAGWYSETKKISYSGKPIQFTISPVLLNEVIHKYDECIIGDTRLKVSVGKFSYVTVLGATKSDEKENK